LYTLQTQYPKAPTRGIKNLAKEKHWVMFVTFPIKLQHEYVT